MQRMSARRQMARLCHIHHVCVCAGVCVLTESIHWHRLLRLCFPLRLPLFEPLVSRHVSLSNVSQTGLETRCSLTCSLIVRLVLAHSAWTLSSVWRSWSCCFCCCSS